MSGLVLAAGGGFLVGLAVGRGVRLAVRDRQVAVEALDRSWERRRIVRDVADEIDRRARARADEIAERRREDRVRREASGA